MNDQDRSEFAKIVLGFAELKGKQLSRAAIDLYWGAMRGWELEDFRQAAEHLLRTCEFMPTPSDFEKLRRAGRVQAGEAWAQVVKYVREGWYHWQGGLPTINAKIPPPPNELIARVVEVLGGYRIIAATDENKLSYLERRFCEHYDALQDANEVRMALPNLAPDPKRLEWEH